jgi:hypothetical protein
MGVCWNRLIRFVTPDGRILRGEPILPHDDFDLGTTTKETGLQAKVIEGNDIYDDTGATTVTEEIAQVAKLLGPLAQDDVDIIRCVGLNYAKHSTPCSSIEVRIECTERLTSHHSQRSRPDTPSVSLHLLQTKHLRCRSRRGRCYPQNRSRRSSRLRGRTLHRHRQRCKGRALGPGSGVRCSVHLRQRHFVSKAAARSQSCRQRTAVGLLQRIRFLRTSWPMLGSAGCYRRSKGVVAQDCC